MTDFKIITADEFDVSNITATEPKKKNDRLQSILLYNGSPFYLESELGRAPFGVKSFDGGEKTDYSLNISLTQGGNLANNLSKLDEYMIDFGVENSKLIFKQKYTPAQREVVRAMYTASVKQSEDGDYPPRIAPKIQKKSQTDLTPGLLFYHSEEEEVEIETFDQLEKLIPKGAKVKAIISLRPWFVSGRFGITMTVQQLLVPKVTGGKPTTYAFGNKTGVLSTKVSATDSIKELEKNVVQEQPDEDQEDQEGTDAVSVEDSDNEQDDQDEEEEEEEEKPQKVVRKPTSAPVQPPVSKTTKPARSANVRK